MGDEMHITQVGPDSGFNPKKALVQFATDMLILFSMTILPITLFKVGEPYNRGFFCDDQSLDYPYQNSTISTGLMVVYTILTPVISIPIFEALGYYQNIRKNPKTLENKRHFKKDLLFNIYHNIWLFLFGYALTQVTIDIAKYSIGRLRPHFFDLCKPYFYQKCNPHIFIKNYTCLRGTPFRIKESKLSFVSGHAACSCYSFVFLAYFLQIHEATRKYTVSKAILQAIYFWIALYTCYTRVSDYKHHWSDVFAGALFGTTVALLVMKFIYMHDHDMRYRKVRSPAMIEMGGTQSKFDPI